MPFISGMFQSTRIRSGGPPASSFSRPSRPWTASEVWKPHSLRIFPRIMRIALESSITIALIWSSPASLAPGGGRTGLSVPAHELLEGHGDLVQAVRRPLRVRRAGGRDLRRLGNAVDVL